MKSIRFNDTLNAFVEIIDKNISDIIPKNTELQLYDAFQYIFEGGGKRIRPIITMVCAGAAGANPMLSLNAAIAIEIIHNFTLVHDDIMDKSPMRRERETIHKKWNNDIAILSGDILIGWAFRILNQSKQFSDSAINSELNLALSNAIIEVCEGQELDMRFNTQQQVSVMEYIEMIKLKTSSLLRCAAKLGSIAAQSSKITLFSVDKFAENFGIAFQDNMFLKNFVDF
jgi:geranylgeranyl diphosphate synthase type II